MTPDITAGSVWSRIPKRGRESNKGSFGAVLAVAGSACYRGAAALTVEGALRTGAGIVTLASVEPVLAAVAARLPECCLCPCEPGAEGGISPQSIPRILRQKATVLLIGPGLGYLAQSSARAAETRTLVKKLLTGFSGSAVLDADGLNAAASLMNGGEEAAPPGQRADPDTPPGRDVPADRAFGGGGPSRPGGHRPAVCRPMERGRGAEGSADRGRRAGWAGLHQPNRQPGPRPGRQRRCAGRYDVGPAGLRPACLRCRRLRGLAPRCRRRPGCCPEGRVWNAPAGHFSPAGRMFAENDR